MPISSGLAVPPMGHAISNRSATYSVLGSNNSTSAGLGVGTLRAAPMYVPRAVTLVRIGAEVTVIGDVGSKLRLGIYADNGNIYPGALRLDAGTIAGDSVAVQEIVISLLLEPGVYWLAGALQDVTVIQPTVRTTNEFPFAPISNAADMSSDMLGVRIDDIGNGALPTPWSSTVRPSTVITRVFVRAA